MDSELKDLIERYQQGRLDAADRQRLREILSGADGRAQILASRCPEMIFLGPDAEEPPQWADFWPPMARRLASHTQIRPGKPRWGRLAAAAAIVAFALLVMLPLAFNNGADQPKTPTAGQPQGEQRQTRSFALRHRLPAEVLHQLRQFMSDDAGLHVSPGSAEIVITDTPARLQSIERALRMLDTPPVRLAISIRILQTRPGEEAQAADVARAVTGSDELDESRFQLLGQMQIHPTDGRHFQLVIRERYDVSCFAQVRDDGKQIELKSLTVYDRHTRSMHRISTALAPGETRAVQSSAGGAGAGTLIAVEAVIDEGN